MGSGDASTSLKFATLDVFTTTRFEGNPLALVHLPRDFSITQAQKQAIAREFNFSETVFLHEDVGTSEGRKYDIFTSTQELSFAGHPTIGTLCYIAKSEGELRSQAIKLLCRAGTVEAQFDHDTLSAEAEIPHNVHIHEDVDLESILVTQPKLRKALASAPADSHATAFPLVSIVNGMNFILVGLSEVVEYIGAIDLCPTPVPNRTSKLHNGWDAGVINPYFYAVLPSSEPEITRLRTRHISHVIGEDPATGSAASALSSYLALQSGDSGKVHSFEIEQGVEMGRPSLIKVKVELDDGGKTIKRVKLSGNAIVVSQGTIEV